jgi:starch phosphorylase
MKHSIASLGSFVTADRMIKDYVDGLYRPAAIQGRKLSADGWARARDLASWKQKIRETWEDVRVIDVSGDVTAADVGAKRQVGTTIHLGRLSTDDVTVQLAHGRVGANHELIDPQLTEMTAEQREHETCSYRGSFATEEAGLYGFAVRVLPRHPDLTNGMDLGVVTWA